MLKIAVVILNWNGVKLLKTFLPSVTKYSDDAQIYIIDNASTDESVAYVKTNFPEIKCILNSENKGYAGGYNKGLKEVKEDIYILLNSDVEVAEGWLKPIKDKFEKQRHVAVIQPKILDYKNPEYFEYAGAAGGFIDAYGYPYCRGRIFSHVEKDEGQYDDDLEIFWASGACFAIRRVIFQKCKGFDESYFAHQEEIDLCWRIFNSGYKIWYCHESVIYHLGGGTLKNLNPKKTYLNFRNSLYNIIKNVPQPNWFNVLFIRLLLDGLASLRFLFLGQFSHIIAIIKAHWIMFSRFFLYFNKRKGNILNDNYFHKTSIIYQYYVLNQKTFKDLE
jgi:GT2 family glycosyltransferase